VGLSRDGKPVRSVLVAGSREGDGSGMLAANLATVLAEGETRVLLVDANSVEGEITRLLALEESPGYGELLASNGGEENGFRIPPGAGLVVLPRGSANGAPLLEVERARGLLDRFLTDADLVVVNAPPLDRSPSTLAWGRAVDATIVVVEGGRTSRDAVEGMVKTLGMVGATVVGTVLRERAGFRAPS
jgi:Mrp family chromosome partitioning ATPase